MGFFTSWRTGLLWEMQIQGKKEKQTFHVKRKRYVLKTYFEGTPQVYKQLKYVIAIRGRKPCGKALDNDK